MKKLLLVDKEFLNKIDKDHYDLIIVKSDEGDFSFDNVSYVHLPKFFMESHKETRALVNNILGDIVNTSPEVLSFFKHSDSYFYNIVRDNLIIKNYKNDYKIYIYQADKYLSKAFSFPKVIVLNDNSLSYFYITKKLISLFFRYSTMLFSKKRNFENIKSLAICWADNISYSYFKDLDRKNIAFWPYLSKKGTLSLSNATLINKMPKANLKDFYYSLKRLILTYRDIKKTLRNIPAKYILNSVISMEKWSFPILKLVEQSSIKYIYGSFDSNFGIDYLTKVVNLNNVKTICVPHGVNYKYKASYISYGTNYYSLWSEEHEKQIRKSVNDPYAAITKITGSFVYKNLYDKFKTKKTSNKINTILIIGEYFSNDKYYGSPFNAYDARRYLGGIKEVASKIGASVSVRCRLNDGYYEVCKELLDDNFKILDNNQSIFEQYFEHDLVVSVFSNALHEALLLRRRVLQINFLGVENYRTLNENNILPCAHNELELEKILIENVFFNDYGSHDKIYLNNCEYNFWREDELLLDM
ncbi:hypothetical protein [Halobacteriovorax sp. ZH5_bin.2]|uniref:hypothetical protein n=1 Tax=Halobacteriovorax sp. ZH5_bin.2 TaxID=3157727 RepID=UPI00371B53B3